MEIQQAKLRLAHFLAAKEMLFKFVPGECEVTCHCDSQALQRDVLEELILFSVRRSISLSCSLVLAFAGTADKDGGWENNILCKNTVVLWTLQYSPQLNILLTC